MKKYIFCDFPKSIVLGSRKAIFLSRYLPNTVFRFILPKNKILTNAHGLIPLEKCIFCDFPKLVFLQSNNAIFLSRKSPNTISRSILPKNRK